MSAVKDSTASAVAVEPKEELLTQIPGFSIRRVRAIEEYQSCETLQKDVWGAADIVGVPILDLVTAQENGGLVLGAFRRDHLAGFVYSFLGLTDDGRLKHCSVLLAVSPLFRGHGIGWALKMAQRQAALRQGIELITWTFDPLMSVNASLNIAKLGARSHCYVENVYGLGQGLNAGLSTDRLLVEWWLQDESLGMHDLPARSEPINVVTRVREDGLPECGDLDLGKHAPVLRLYIPRDIQTIKGNDLQVASHWRTATRELFECYFNAGYEVTGFNAERYANDASPFYLLTRAAGPGTAWIC